MAIQLDLEVSWFWEWVPAAGSDEPARAAWTESVADRLDEWVGGKVAVARAAWPADAGEDFPFTAGEMGSAVARDLLLRAGDMPANCRLIWGAGFAGDDARWLPLMVLTEFRQARPGDSAYLMELAGAGGMAGDLREPTVEYVTTEHGDGVRVVALARSEADGLYGRVNAALRLEGPAGDVDVLLETRVKGLDQLAVIGAGVEAVMFMIADQHAAGPLRFVAPSDGDRS
jgi:hypothetical protein